MSVSSHLQNFNIPEEFRQAPSAGFGELLGKVGDHENYTNKSQLSRVGAPPPSPFSVEGMRQVDEQLRNKSSAEDTDIDNLMEELLNDVDIDEEKSINPRDSNSNSINFPSVKEEKDLVKIENPADVPALDQLGLLGLHSEVSIKPEQPEEKKPSLSIRKDIFQSNPLQMIQQPNMMHESHNQSRSQSQSHYQRARYVTRRGDGVPLYDDPTLPPGWRRTVSQRKSGATAGGWDTYILAPPSHHNKRFRSKQEVRRYFEKIGEQYLDWRDFDFNPYGSKGQQEMLQEMRRNPNMMGNLLFQAQGFSQQQPAQIEINPDISSFLSCELKQEFD